MISSPRSSWADASRDPSSAWTTSRLADDPELTMIAWLAPIHSANSDSNCRTRRPIVSWPDSRTAFAAAISASPKVSAASGYAADPGDAADALGSITTAPIVVK